MRNRQKTPLTKKVRATPAPTFRYLVFFTRIARGDLLHPGGFRWQEIEINLSRKVASLEDLHEVKIAIEKEGFRRPYAITGLTLL